jgi:hypothetical protein
MTIGDFTRARFNVDTSGMDKMGTINKIEATLYEKAAKLNGIELALVEVEGDKNTLELWWPKEEDKTEFDNSLERLREMR